MIGVSVNPNSVYVPLIQTGFLKSKFDSTYPIHLNGIISQDEFRQSINRINRSISSNEILIFLAIVFGLSIIGGIILFLIGGITAVHSGILAFPPLIGVGFGLFAFGSLFVFIGCCIIQSQCEARMQGAIAEESMKYSSKIPTPCCWRLETTRNCVGESGHHRNNHLVYHLVIDIGHSIATANDQVIPEPTANVEPENNSLPPPYVDQPIEFCSLHKQLLNKY